MRLFCRCGKRTAYTVTTLGWDADTGKEIEQVYGPFSTKSAAKNFRLQWSFTFKGIAVVDAVAVAVAVDIADTVR
jgi:hypothetical protein